MPRCKSKTPCGLQGFPQKLLQSMVALMLPAVRPPLKIQNRSFLNWISFFWHGLCFGVVTQAKTCSSKKPLAKARTCVQNTHHSLRSKLISWLWKTVKTCWSKLPLTWIWFSSYPAPSSSSASLEASGELQRQPVQANTGLRPMGKLWDRLSKPQ